MSLFFENNILFFQNVYFYYPFRQESNWIGINKELATVLCRIRAGQKGGSYYAAEQIFVKNQKFSLLFRVRY